MQALKLTLIAAVGISVFGTASAHRTTPIDTWQGAPSSAPSGPPPGTSLVFDSTTTLPSGTLPSWLTNLTITPSSSGDTIGGSNVQVQFTGGPDADMWPLLAMGDDGMTYEAQVALYPTSTTLRIDLNYAAPSCANQTASFSINGLSFSSSNPCAGTPMVSPEDDEFQQSEFVFGVNGAGKVVLEGAVPTSWSAGSGASAPEIDPRGILSNLALLAGILAVTRRSQRVIRTAAAA